MSFNNGIEFFDVLFENDRRGKVYIDCFVSKEEINKIKRMKNIKILNFFSNIINKRTGQIKEKYKNCFIIVKNIRHYGYRGAYEILKYDVFNIEENENGVLKEKFLFSFGNSLLTNQKIKKNILKVIAFHLYKNEM